MLRQRLKNLQNISPRLTRLGREKIAVLGLGIENYALVKYLLKKKVECEITICDRRKKEELKKEIGELGKYNVIAKKVTIKNSPNPLYTKGAVSIKWQLGEKIGQRNLKGFDILFLSPGGPLDAPDIREALKTPLTPLLKGGVKKKVVSTPLVKGGGGVILSSPMQLFFELCPTKNIIGVTGTKGKGTTSSLIYEILKSAFAKASVDKEAGKRVWLGGNIGVAPFEFLEKIKKDDWVVLELSSFQLENMTVSPHISVITNFYKEHLAPADPFNPNYHKSLKSYWEAKMNIVKWQKKNDYAVINNKIQDTRLSDGQARYKIQIDKLKSKKIYFTKTGLSSRLIGEHNKENIAAAVEVAKIVGVKNDIIKKAVAGFKGLEHRLEFVKQIRGVKYYNDSFATTPESTIIALKSFGAPVILLVGGADKAADFRNMAKEIYPVKSPLKRGAKRFNRVKFVILLNGTATPRIKKELLKIKYPTKNLKLVYNMKAAIKEAKKAAAPGDIVLLSPACASFGMFKNYKERGRLFKLEVKRKGDV